MPLRLLLIALSLLQLLCLPAYAAKSSFFEPDFDEDAKPWEEIQAQLPAYPNLAEAIAFEVSPALSAKFFIDPKSITVSADGVVRYSLIAQSSGGVLNVSYEGIRCETSDTKLYAIGRKENLWARNKYAKWEDISGSVKDPRHVLYQDFFCPRGIIVDNANEAISALKNGIHPRAQN